MSKTIKYLAPVTETATVVASLNGWAQDRQANKETAADIRGANKSISALVARAGFVAFATNTLKDVKEAFRDAGGKSENSMLPAWSFIRSDFSHGALIAEFLMTGGRIKIANAIVNGQPVQAITGEHVASLMEPAKGDIEVSSLWKHVTKAKKAREENAENAARFEADCLSEYLTSKQCAEEHKGMDVDELRDHLRVNGGYDTAMDVGRAILKLKAEALEAQQAVGFDQSQLDNAIGVLKRRPELRDAFLAQLASLETEAAPIADAA